MQTSNKLKPMKSCSCRNCNRERNKAIRTEGNRTLRHTVKQFIRNNAHLLINDEAAVPTRVYIDRVW